MKTTLPFFVALLIIVSCASSKLTSIRNIQDLEVPPGTQKIAANLYLDMNEIRNLDYLEFLYWNKSVYGVQSNEYRKLLPDTNHWSKLDIKYLSLDTLYLRDPNYRRFTVVGVSNDQVKLFSKWRSDRVMEFMLIRDKVIKWDAKPTKDEFFTIEKYFSGNYKNTKPNPYLLYYPEYTLLDSAKNTFQGFRNICTYKKWEN